MKAIKTNYCTNNSDIIINNADAFLPTFEAKFSLYFKPIMNDGTKNINE